MAITVATLRGSLTSVSRKWIIAIVSEGFTEAEMTGGLNAFDSAAQSVATEIVSTAPFSSFADSIVIVAVAVPSHSSSTLLGTAPSHRCSPPPLPADFSTPFGARYCHQSLDRSLSGDSSLVKDTVRSQPNLAGVQDFVVLVNNQDLEGGSAVGGVGWLSLKGKFETVAVHELGHSAFDLIDEYPYRELGAAPRSLPLIHPFNRVNGKNVTTARALEDIPWKDMVTTPRLPTTRDSSPCTIEHTLIEPIDQNAVGLFEGAAQFACGVFRPEFQCKMRKEEATFFCRVCDREIRLDLARRAFFPHRVGVGQFGSFSHVVPFTHTFEGIPDSPSLLAYNQLTGALAIFRTGAVVVSPNHPLAASPDGRKIAPLFSSVISVVRGIQNFFLFTDLSTGNQSYMKVDASGTDLVEVWSGNGLNSGFTHVMPINGTNDTFYLAYGAFTGQFTIRRFEEDGTEPTEIFTGSWEPFWTSMISADLPNVRIAGSIFGEEDFSYVIAYQWTNGRVKIRKIDMSNRDFPNISDVFVSPLNFWAPNQTHIAPLEIRRDHLLLRYSGIDGWASLHHPRNGGTGVDMLWGGYPPPSGANQPEAFFGAGGLSIMGVGAPAFGAFRIKLNDVGLDEHRLWFYNASTGEIHLYALG
jgi:hypothetical protein